MLTTCITISIAMFCSKVFVVAVVILDVTDEVLKHIFILFIRVQRLYK